MLSNKLKYRRDDLAANEEDLGYKGFLVEREKAVSGFNNNCGLNCILGHVLDRVNKNPDDPIFNELPYQNLLKYLNENLELEGEERLKDFHDVKFLFENFKNYQDLEKIFTLSMRRSLSDAWTFYYQSKDHEVHKNIMIKVNKILDSIVPGVGINLDPDDSIEETGEVYQGNFALFQAYATKVSPIKKLRFMTKLNEVGDAEYTIDTYKEELKSLIIKSFPDMDNDLVEIARMSGLDYYRLQYSAAKQNNKVSHAWIAFLKVKYGTEDQRRINISPELIREITPYLHSLANKEGRFSFEEREIMRLLGATKDGEKFTFASEDIGDIDFTGSDRVYTVDEQSAPVLPEDDSVWGKPDNIESTIIDLNRELNGVNLEDINNIEEFVSMSRFANHYMTGIHMSIPRLYELAMENHDAPSEELQREIKEFYAGYTNYLAEIEYRGDPEVTLDALLNPSEDDVIAFNEVIDKCKKYEEAESKVISSVMPGWLEYMKISHKMIGEGVTLLSSYMGINTEIYTSQKGGIDITSSLDGVTKIEYPKSTSTHKKPLINIEEGRGFIINEEDKTLELVFKDEAMYKKYTMSTAIALSLFRTSCPRVSEGEIQPDGTVKVKYDCKKIDGYTKDKVLDLLRHSSSITSIHQTRNISVPMNLTGHQDKTLKVINPHNAHWQRELAPEDIALYRERDRAPSIVFAGRTEFKKTLRAATKKADFYTEEEYRSIIMKHLRGEKHREVFSSSSEEVCDVVLMDAKSEWRELVPQLLADRQRRVVTLASTLASTHVSASASSRKRPSASAHTYPIKKRRSASVEATRIDTPTVVTSSGQPTVRSVADKVSRTSSEALPTVHRPDTATRVVGPQIRREGRSPRADKVRTKPSSAAGSPISSPPYDDNHHSMRSSRRASELMGKLEDLGGGQSQLSRTPIHKMTSYRDRGARGATPEKDPTLTDMVVYGAGNEQLTSLLKYISSYVDSDKPLVTDDDKLTINHPKYNEYYDEFGDLKDSIKLEELEFEVETAKAFQGKEVRATEGDSGAIEEYSVVDAVTDKEIVNAHTKDGDLCISASNREYETIYLMLAPVVDLMESKGKKGLKIDVNDSEVPEFALKIFEIAISKGLHPRIKDQATLDALSSKQELQKRYEDLKDSISFTDVKRLKM